MGSITMCGWLSRSAAFSFLGCECRTRSRRGVWRGQYTPGFQNAGHSLLRKLTEAVPRVQLAAAGSSGGIITPGVCGGGWLLGDRDTRVAAWAVIKGPRGKKARSHLGIQQTTGIRLEQVEEAWSYETVGCSMAWVWGSPKSRK